MQTLTHPEAGQSAPDFLAMAMAAPKPDAHDAREDLCRFLAACYYEPTSAFTEEGLFESMHAAAAVIDDRLAAQVLRLGHAFAAQDLQSLLVDYTRLFLGPVRPLASPYGSHWLGEGATLMHESTLAVRELYRDGGFEVDDDFPELPDHVAVELEFLYLLTFTEHSCVRMADAALGVTRALKQRFLREHLGAWVSPFARAVAEGAQTAFYRELAAVTERIVQAEAKAE